MTTSSPRAAKARARRAPTWPEPPGRTRRIGEYPIVGRGTIRGQKADLSLVDNDSFGQLIGRECGALFVGEQGAVVDATRGQVVDGKPKLRTTVEDEFCKRTFLSSGR